ncbi:diaminopimelate decarboxylase [Corynebacterium testudinoris]|uniref:Diaminopimelate decarboxylase n=1 Tax=Corynebacterium testudinoris TaxID=136857 RepID=A0A0G3H6V2_9CORY|nr:diaminopimelate decarboxylase [Corynebacterium testudinoris]AKK08485.1 diaminopimelate decarboxylase [Corynebacterium testudinoris]MBX8994695.1 diaminopimelate decarboxylase [Corynebacterium testudinoris]
MAAADFNELPAHVWPRNARREEDGVVTIAGVPLPEIAEQYGTPVFVVDEDDFRSRCQDMARAFGGPQHVHYASKAFLTRAVARWVDEEGLSLDVASHNELQIALLADFPAERITAHGNNKGSEFLRACVVAGVGHVVLDSDAELRELNAIAAAEGRTQQVMIRVKPGIEAHTHEAIATSHEDQKFGFSLASGSAFRAAAAAVDASNLDLVGLHCHVGSQVFDATGFTMAADRVLGLYSTIHRELGVELAELDLGGGYGIAYTEDEQPLDVDEVAHDLLTAVAKTAAELGIEAPAVLVEPGRAIAGPGTVTVYEVGTVKDVTIDDGVTRRYLSVDGGMSDNIRPALYGSLYDARVVNRDTEAEGIPSRLVGAHCESGDILVRDARYPSDIGEGDLIAVAATGAYAYAMSSRYNAFGRPAVVAVRAGKSRLMLRRETIADILALEP